MYKLLLAASLFTSIVSAQYGGSESYSGGGSVEYEAPAGGEYGSDSGESYVPPAYGEEKPSKEPCKPKPMPGGGMMHKVIVGGDDGLIYNPESIMAEAGDVVQFHFLKMNHTVTQSTFDKPCVKKQDGEDSSFKPTQLGSLDPNAPEDPNLIWEYKVLDKEPTWWYCKQKTGSHCGKGMVFNINANKEKTFAKFLESAQKQNGTGEATPPPAGGEYALPPPQEGGEYVPKDPKLEKGWNAGGDGACSCQCLCGSMDFPSQYGWGKESKGGDKGYAPAPWNTGSSGESYVEQPPKEEYAPQEGYEVPAEGSEEYAPPAEQPAEQPAAGY